MPERIPFGKEVQYCLGANDNPSGHVEPDPHTFHASHFPYCRRQAYLRKFGLLRSTRAYGRFFLGNLLHDQLREWFGLMYPDLEFEKPIETVTDDGIRIVGHADCYDPRENVVYEFKTRANWYRLHRPHDRHRRQVESYLRGTGADGGQIVYISKSDLEIRYDPQLFDEDDERPMLVNTDPVRVAFVDDNGHILSDQPTADEPAFFPPDDERYLALLEKARDIRAAVLENGIATSADEIPFERCGCYFCDIERLSFEDVPSLEQPADQSQAPTSA